MADLVTGVRRHLAAQSALTQLLGTDDTYQTWIFRWRPYVSVEGTGSAMVVIRQQGSWASANTHNTMRFPRLVLDVYADVQRATTGLPKRNIAQAATAEEAAFEISYALDKLLHLPAGGTSVWGEVKAGDPLVVTDPGIRVISSFRTGEPDLRELQGGDGVMVALNTYQVTVG